MIVNINQLTALLVLREGPLPSNELDDGGKDVVVGGLHMRRLLGDFAVLLDVVGPDEGAGKEDSQVRPHTALSRHPFALDVRTSVGGLEPRQARHRVRPDSGWSVGRLWNGRGTTRGTDQFCFVRTEHTNLAWKVYRTMNNGSAGCII